MPVPRAACSTAPPTSTAAADLLVDGAVWQHMVNQQSRLLSALDRWIARLERAHEDRTAAGIKAGETVRARPTRRCWPPSTPAGTAPPPAAPTRAATTPPSPCAALVAEAAGIPLHRARRQRRPATSRLDPRRTHRARRPRCRTRVIKLTGALVAGELRPARRATAPAAAHRSHCCGGAARYEATTRPPASAADRQPRAQALRARAVMFYRPLPDGRAPLRLLRFGLCGTTHRTCATWSSAASSRSASARSCRWPPARCSACTCPTPRTASSCRPPWPSWSPAVVSAAFMLMQNTSILRLEGRLEATLQPAVWDRLLRLPTRSSPSAPPANWPVPPWASAPSAACMSGIAPVAVQAVTLGRSTSCCCSCFSVTLALRRRRHARTSSVPSSSPWGCGNCAGSGDW